MMTKRGIGRLLLGAAMAALATSGLMAADSYYTEEPQFHQWPDPNAARYEISRIRPVGIGLELIQPAFTMRISNVEPGSPAEASGQLKKGQIIESINGRVLKDRDPRVILGDMITQAEAQDGVLKMMVKDDPKGAAREVVVKIPALGAYSDTWPVDCPKSDKIIRNFADFLAEIDQPNHGAALFLLSTGEQKDLDVVVRWFKDKLKKEISVHAPNRTVDELVGLYRRAGIDDYCDCASPLQSLWEKEVLMMRAEIELPPLKEGHAYRILVGGRSHVNAGDGSDLWIDGKYMAARRKQDPSLTGVGKRQGGKPWGKIIDDSFRADFEDGRIILSATGFLNYAGGRKANRQSFWFEEMKLPPVGE